MKVYLCDKMWAQGDYWRWLAEHLTNEIIIKCWQDSGDVLGSYELIWTAGWYFHWFWCNSIKWKIDKTCMFQDKLGHYCATIYSDITSNRSVFCIRQKPLSKSYHFSSMLLCTGYHKIFTWNPFKISQPYFCNSQ